MEQKISIKFSVKSGKEAAIHQTWKAYRKDTLKEKFIRICPAFLEVSEDTNDDARSGHPTTSHEGVNIKGTSDQFCGACFFSETKSLYLRVS